MKELDRNWHQAISTIGYMARRLFSGLLSQNYSVLVKWLHPIWRSDTRRWNIHTPVYFYFLNESCRYKIGYYPQCIQKYMLPGLVLKYGSDNRLTADRATIRLWHKKWNRKYKNWCSVPIIIRLHIHGRGDNCSKYYQVYRITVTSYEHVVS